MITACIALFPEFSPLCAIRAARDCGLITKDEYSEFMTSYADGDFAEVCARCGTYFSMLNQPQLCNRCRRV
jgi:hypothetical protein